MFVMKFSNMYGEVVVSEEVFNKLNSDYFITHSTDTVKFMCANENEKQHLESLGIRTVDSDWYKIKLGEK